MDTRKVQQLGPSTAAITMPAGWVKEHGIEKGDEITVQHNGNRVLEVVAESNQDKQGVAIHAETLSGDRLERAIITQYVLGRRVIRVNHADGVLDNTHINAVYNAETQLMGLGVVEETPEQISIRCSVDANDFQLDHLLERLENTGHTMHTEAIKALAVGNADLARRASTLKTQANRIFVLLLRLIFSAQQTPPVARAVGLEDVFPLIGYRSIAKNLDLTADTAHRIAELALKSAESNAEPDPSVVTDIRDFTEHIDDLMQQSVRAVVERDFDLALEVHTLSTACNEREDDCLDNLSTLSTDDPRQLRRIVILLQRTVEYALRNADIAANLAMHDKSNYFTFEERRPTSS